MDCDKDFIKEIKPFETIGVCFSGGGYRATFFSLGVISYLNNVKYKDKSILNNVEAISTVSGGTLLGLAYAKAIQDDNFNFNIFFNQFYENFTPKNDKLLENSIAKLNDDALWKNNHKRRSLINAFALTYSKMDIFTGSFNYFKDSSKHLKHVCFNATEFSFGLPFRFQNKGLFGNNPIHNSELNKIKYHVELGDIVASSSCFPLGFEPLVFPNDFFKNHDDNLYRNIKSQPYFEDGIGIMDGGITDNQGVGSMLNINNSKKLDLIIVNDVGSFKMDPWTPDNTKITKGNSLKESVSSWLSYLSIKPLYWILLLIGLSIVILNSFQLTKGVAWASLYIIGSILIGIGLTLSSLGIILSIYKKTGSLWFKNILKKNIPSVLLDDVSNFKKLNINLVKRMFQDRITSTVKMVNDVFLKQIRRLNYNLLYTDDSLKKRIIMSSIYELNGQKTVYSKANNYNKNIKPAPSKFLKNIALNASEMPTTLWWDEKDIAKKRMDALIACGQFTTCYNLLDYVLDLKTKFSEYKDDEGIQKELEELHNIEKALIKDWKMFNENPFFLVEEEKK